ncbi:MAG: hypothetical protein ONA69_02725 [candidate division KSB1 bacterium]|nr:hypothetical protein [candidate division KSB1 bacterium]
MRIEHWTNAVEQGTHAAAALLAGPEAAEPFAPVPFVWSDQYDTKIQFVGHLPGADRSEVVAGRLEDRRFVAAFGTDRVAYAAKAFLCGAMTRLVHEEGLHLDVATGGELFAVPAAIPFPANHEITQVLQRRRKTPLLGMNEKIEIARRYRKLQRQMDFIACNGYGVTERQSSIPRRQDSANGKRIAFDR